MTEHEASRTLVKSGPELWSECSDAAALARHLGQFGEIRITKLEPETSVAWEGEQVSGTVRFEPSGWGTRVILTARSAGWPGVPEVAVPEVAVPEVAVPEVAVPEVAVPEVAVPEVAVPESLADQPPPPVDPDPPGPEFPEPEVPEPQPPEPDPEPLPPAAAEATHPSRARGLMARLARMFRAPEGQASMTSAAPGPLAPPGPDPAPEPHRDPECEPDPESEPDPEAEPESDPESEPVIAPAGGPDDPGAILTAALDSLGQAHHRPFSRA